MGDVDQARKKSAIRSGKAFAATSDPPKDRRPSKFERNNKPLDKTKPPLKDCPRCIRLDMPGNRRHWMSDCPHKDTDKPRVAIALGGPWTEESEVPTVFGEFCDAEEGGECR